MRKLIGILALCAAGTATAQEAYIGFGLGNSSTDEVVEGWPEQTDQDTVWKGFAGMMIGENGFAEASIGSLGDFSSSVPGWAHRVDVELRQISGAFGLMMKAGALMPYAKVGLASWYANADGALELTDGSVIYGTGYETVVDPMYGLGAMLQATDRLMVRFDFERFTNVGDGMKLDFGSYYGIAEGSDVDVISVGLAYAL